jgi:hypothetical protein
MSGAALLDRLTRDVTQDRQRTVCACGCGQLLNRVYVRAVALKGQGLTTREISQQIQAHKDYVKTLLWKPPRFLVGHFVRSVDRALYERPCRGCGGPVSHPGHTPYCWRKSCPGAAERSQWLHEQWLKYDEAVAERAAEREWRARQNAASRLLSKEQRAAERERDRDQIQYLRDLVGAGWSRDRGPLDGRVISLEGMAERFGTYDFLTGNAHDYGSEEYLERKAAGLLLDFSAALTDEGLVTKAMQEPDVLTDDERLTLRAVYEDAETLVLRGDVPVVRPTTARVAPLPDGPAGGSTLKRGRGRGRHRGTAKTKAGRQGGWTQGRHEGKEQVSDEKAIRMLRREQERAQTQQSTHREV